MTAESRPLSPHLQVYRRQYTMVLSILHRITGVGLSLALVLLVVWLLLLAGDAQCLATFAALSGSILGRLVLGGCAAAFWYHFCTGVRHLVFDTARGMERRESRRIAALTVALAALLALASFAVAFGVGGAA